MDNLNYQQSICQPTEFTGEICDPTAKTLILRKQARHIFVRFTSGRIPQKILSGKVSRNPTYSWTKVTHSDTHGHRPSIAGMGGPRIQSALSGHHPEPSSPPGFRQGGADAPPCPSGFAAIQTAGTFRKRRLRLSPPRAKPIRATVAPPSGTLVPVPR